MKNIEDGNSKNNGHTVITKNDPEKYGSDPVQRLHFMDFCRLFNLASIIIKPDGIIDFYSPRMVKLTGYSLANTTSISSLLNKLFPDDVEREIKEKSFDELFKKPAGTELPPLTLNILSKSGITKKVLFKISRSMEDTIFLFVDEVATDTGSKKPDDTDDRYKNLFMNSAVGMCQSTVEGKIIIANPAFVSMFKINSQDEAKLISIPDQLFTVPTAWDDYINVLIKQKEIKGLETSYRRMDGQIIHVREYTRLIELPDGSQIIECSFEDITEKRQVERTMLEAKELAERSDRLKSEFLAQMSHEVRTPINAILSFSTLLKEELYETIDEDLKQSFDVISSAGKRLTRTMDLFINVAQMRSGTYEFVRREFDICNDALEVVVPDYYSLISEKGLDLIVEKDSDENIISGDIPSIKQIFSNLVDNAIKFTSSGYVKISVRKNLVSKKVTVEISDTGIGISGEYLENMFTLFSQEDQGYSRSYEGSGLGLALVKNYCDMNGAEIKVTSEKGKGSSFYIEFDLHE